MPTVNCACGRNRTIRIFPFSCLCKRVYRTADDTPAPGVIPATAGPGTELRKLFAELGVKGVAGCGCAKRARQMDLWGVAGCREHFAEIREWLTEARSKTSWLDTVRVSAALLTIGLDDLTDPVGSLIRLAIARAEFATTATSAN